MEANDRKQAKVKHLAVYLTEEEWLAIRHQAVDANVSLSGFMRTRLGLPASLK